MQNDKDYWEKQFSNCIERKMKLAQAKFFYNVFKKIFPESLRNELNKNEYICCDFGCGLGNFTNNLYEMFPKFEICGVDYSKNAISYAQKHFPKVHFLNLELNNLKNKYDVVVTSNTLEHFSNPDEIMKELLTHTKKFFMILVPYEEYERYQEHLFTFERSFFKDSFENFELIFLKSIDLSSVFNTMWLGKQVLAVYKSKDVLIDFKKDVTDSSDDKLNFIRRLNYRINLFRRDTYRCLRKFLAKVM
ncbi:MAG: class I SAM-dependent methyltransferase [Alphaproteobacteria bacterium]|nr:class I SAM-dependent methyltransferase [Alphaproteobacteria bacterium]